MLAQQEARPPARVLSVLADTNRELGTTTAVIAHNAPIAVIADREITLSDGLVAGAERNPLKLAPSELRW